jgi:CBS-domain-containing membrane protein
MFSIYGISGQVFNGPLEAMDRVNNLARIRHVRPIAQEGDELGVEVVTPRPQEEALRAYREMIHRDIDRGPIYHASQIMTGSVITVEDHSAVAKAWNILRDGHIRQAPVVDVRYKLVGIVSERDLLTAIDIDGDQVIETLHRKVHDVMTTPVVAAAPITDIRRIAAVMLDQGVDGVPVVNDTGYLVGFVSRSDVLRAVMIDPPLSLWR